MNRLSIRRDLCNLIESPDDTIIETEKRITLLLKTGNEKHQQIALKLWSCLEEDDHDCNSLACKQCTRTKRIKVIESVLPKVIGNNYRFVTVILYHDVLSKSELHALKPQKLKEQLYRDLKKVGITSPVYGALEVDFNEGEQVWLPHFHLLVEADEDKMKSLKAKLKRRHSIDVWNGKTPRPVKEDPIRDAIRQVSYIYKFMWQTTLVNGGKVRGALDNYCTALEYLDSLSIDTLLVQYGVRSRK
ncbi:hypothetical protein WP8S18E11_39440 [Aeromonas veronii]|nr:hypothetical protein WP8S18E11_39440 [Aeromonas veronii]